MVENVKGFCTELQFQPLVNWKLAADRQVHLPGTEASHKISRCISGATRLTRDGVVREVAKGSCVDRATPWTR